MINEFKQKTLNDNNKIQKGLAENEVIYDFDEVYNSVCIDLTKGEENA